MRVITLALLALVALPVRGVGQIAFMGLPFGSDDKVVKDKMTAEGFKCWPQESRGLSKAGNWTVMCRDCSGSLMDTDAEVSFCYNLKPGGLFKGATADGGVKKVGIALNSTREPALDVYDRVAKVLAEKYGKPIEERSGAAQTTRWEDAAGNILRLSFQQTTPPSSSYYYHGRHHSPNDPVVRYVVLEYLAADWVRKELELKGAQKDVL